MTRPEADRIIAASHAGAFVREADLVAALAVLREPVPAASVVGDAPRTIHFEQDGAYFAFRDRPFYRTAFDAMTDDGMSLGVCASFACKAPMRVRDFDMQAAEQAAAWFVAECGRYGFKAERAPDYMSQPEVREHPECERDDLARCHIDCAEMSIADFAALRAVGAAAPASAMVPQPCQQQQARARGRTPQPARGERRYVTVRDTENGDVHRVLTSVARVGVAVVIFTPSNRHRQGELGGMLITHDDIRKAWVFNDEVEARRMLSRNGAPGERVIRAELISDPAAA